MNDDLYVLFNNYMHALYERKRFGTVYLDTDEIIISYLARIIKCIYDADSWLEKQLVYLEEIGITKEVLEENGIEITGFCQ